MALDINKGIELLEEENYEEAYNYFNDYQTANPKNIDSRYYRAFIDFFHIRKNILNDYNDFKFLVDKKTKYKDGVLPLLVIVCDELSLGNEVIKYGHMAITFDHPYLSDIKNLLIKALSQSSNPNSHIEALALIDNMIAEDEDAPLEVYLQKVDIQIKFHDLDGADKTIEEIFTKFPANANVYFVKGKLALAYATQKLKDESEIRSQIENAIRAFEISLEYDSSMNGSRLLLAECYGIIGNIEKSFEALDEFRNVLGNNLSNEQLESLEADIVVEKVKICESTKEWELGVTICNEFLVKYTSWKVLYSLGYIQNVIATSQEELLVSANTIEEAYNSQGETFLLPDLVNINTILKRFEKNDIIINKAIEKEPDNGLLYYLLAENTARFNYDYDKLIECYQKAYSLGYMDEANYITHISFLTKEPQVLAKKSKKILEQSIKYNVWDQRRSAIRYLFGEFGFKQDIVKANQILNNCNKIEPNEPCILTIYGRSEELLGHQEEAFKIYKQAYEIYQKEIHMTCNCANGYLAQSYLNGVGTTPDKEYAKELIIEGINKDKELSSSIVIYHYAYFALNSENGFNLKDAYEYLKSNFPFDRYDIVRMLYMNKVCLKLGISAYFNDLDIKECLKRLPKEYTVYYKNNKDKENIYPYYKSF